MYLGRDFTAEADSGEVIVSMMGTLDHVLEHMENGEFGAPEAAAAVGAPARPAEVRERAGRLIGRAK
ncbi:hypothetical protein OR263_03320 [Streptomyces sp. NEAU-H22]|uniref:hypothetical protein n=1 Tax=Streptomyces sp. NEAU-H22 TaxID=2994655 RepID=UPI0022561502|nr:hypothetical protein [Streptomyces sp. NEAU-H22]MCX3285764.1 hypothetical protein [Streptomyces sp. NEAU-H22]